MRASWNARADPHSRDRPRHAPCLLWTAAARMHGERLANASSGDMTHASGIDALVVRDGLHVRAIPWRQSGRTAPRAWRLRRSPAVPFRGRVMPVGMALAMAAMSRRGGPESSAAAMLRGRNKTHSTAMTHRLASSFLLAFSLALAAHPAHAHEDTFLRIARDGEIVGRGLLRFPAEQGKLRMRSDDTEKRDVRANLRTFYVAPCFNPHFSCTRSPMRCR